MKNNLCWPFSWSATILQVTFSKIISSTKVDQAPIHVHLKEPSTVSQEQKDDDGKQLVTDFKQLHFVNISLSQLVSISQNIAYRSSVSKSPEELCRNAASQVSPNTYLRFWISEQRAFQHGSLEIIKHSKV